MATPAAATIAVAGLWVYPVKGCKGIPLQAAAVLPTGLAYDRSWMVVRSDTGKFLTQRQLPKMCQIAVSLPPEALLGAEWGKLQPGAALTLAAPGMPAPVQVPLTQPGGAAPVTTRRVNVWEWSGAAADEGDEAAEWLSTYLDRPVRLVRHIGGSESVPAGEEAPTVRTADPEFAQGHEVKFADGFPLLVARQENLVDLNNRLANGSDGGAGGVELSMNRFRPNIILAGGGVDAWADDAWGSVGIGSPNNNDSGASAAGVQLAYVKPCSRCKVTTINQETAEEGREPLKTLGTFRSGKVLGWSEQRRSWTHDVFFGWNCCVTRPGHIRVGDVLSVLQGR